MSELTRTFAARLDDFDALAGELREAAQKEADLEMLRKRLEEAAAKAEPERDEYAEKLDAIGAMARHCPEALRHQAGVVEHIASEIDTLEKTPERSDEWRDLRAMYAEAAAEARKMADGWDAKFPALADRLIAPSRE